MGLLRRPSSMGSRWWMRGRTCMPWAVWLRTRQPGRCPRANSARELRAHIAGLPEGLRAVIERACAFEPSARYQTAADLGAAFAGAASGAGAGSQAATGQQTAEVQAASGAPAFGGAPSPTVPPDFASPRPRRSLRRPLLAVAALVLVAAIACGAWFASGGPARPCGPCGRPWRGTLSKVPCSSRIARHQAVRRPSGPLPPQASWWRRRRRPSRLPRARGMSALGASCAMRSVSPTRTMM